jgi:hypothetical protein
LSWIARTALALRDYWHWWCSVNKRLPGRVHHRHRERAGHLPESHHYDPTGRLAAR